MYIEPRFCFHEIYYGPFLMVNNNYVSGSGQMAWRILELFGLNPFLGSTSEEHDQWEKFTEWLWYTYPIGLWISA